MGWVVSIGSIPTARVMEEWGLPLWKQWLAAIMNRKYSALAKSRGVKYDYHFMSPSGQQLAAIAKLDRDTKSQYGVSGVPYYMIYPNHGSDKPVAFSGAYPPEVIAKQLEEASASSS